MYSPVFCKAQGTVRATGPPVHMQKCHNVLQTEMEQRCSLLPLTGCRPKEKSGAKMVAAEMLSHHVCSLWTTCYLFRTEEALLQLFWTCYAESLLSASLSGHPLTPSSPPCLGKGATVRRLAVCLPCRLSQI